MKSLSLLMILCFLCNCAPAQFEPFSPPAIELPDTSYYSVKETIESLPKPESLKKTWVVAIKNSNGDIVSFKPTSKAQGTHILLTQGEYAKVGILVKRAVALKEIAYEQETLTNTYIDQLNEVKRLFLLEQEKAKSYRQLWIDSENAYRQEEAQHKVDNRINRTGMYLITIGSIIAIALAL